MAAALGDLERASWLMTWGVLCRNSKLSIRRTCVCVSVILHPSWTHILIFRPSEKGAVSSENETHLGEKAGSIVFALGEGNPANGMSCGELSALRVLFSLFCLYVSLCILMIVNGALLPPS